MAIYLLFVDGIGLGRAGLKNPITSTDLPAFREWSGGVAWSESMDRVEHNHGIIWSVDALLEVQGLPQSGTGQASLFTGVNCAKRAGKHFGPFPHSSSKPLLKESSLFHQWKERGGNPHFINAYPERFFQQDGDPRRWSCTTYMTVHSGLSLNREEDVQKGLALTAELDQQVWRDQLGVDIPEISMGEAAERLIRKGEIYDLVLFEYFLTDRAGHKQKRDSAEQVLKKLDRFMGEVMNRMGDEDWLVLCSDHGNLEDLTVRTHTLNRVPMAVYRRTPWEISQEPTRLTDLSTLLFSINGW